MILNIKTLKVVQIYSTKLKAEPCLQKALMRTLPIMYAMLVVPETLYDPAWYPNSGAINYLTPDNDYLMGKSVYNRDSRIKMANGEATSIKHFGNSR